MHQTQAPRPDIHVLPDGTRLMLPQDRSATSLHVEQWVRVDDRPWRIVDLRQSGVSGRIVHLNGHPLHHGGHPPVSLAPGGCLPVYTKYPPPAHTAEPPRSRPAARPDEKPTGRNRTP